jgi:hypothetical protein
LDVNCGRCFNLKEMDWFLQFHIAYCYSSNFMELRMTSSIAVMEDTRYLYRNFVRMVFGKRILRRKRRDGTIAERSRSCLLRTSDTGTHLLHPLWSFRTASSTTLSQFHPNFHPHSSSSVRSWGDVVGEPGKCDNLMTVIVESLQLDTACIHLAAMPVVQDLILHNIKCAICIHILRILIHSWSGLSALGV